MRRLGIGLLVVISAGVLGPKPRETRADDSATAVIEKGIAALGGEAKLAKATAMKWRAEGKLTIEGNDNDFSIRYAVEGLDHLRTEFEGEFNGNEIKGSTVLAGAKGWRSFNETNPLDDDGVENEKRNLYLQVVPVTLAPLKGKGFKAEVAGDEKVGDKPARVLKITGPDGKTFRLMFDKESGLPVKLIATVIGFGGEDFEQTSTFHNYKEMGGIKKATRVEVLRDGDPFLKMDVKEFQVIDKLPEDTFAEPK